MRRALRAGRSRGLIELRQSVTNGGDLVNHFLWPVLMLATLWFLRDRSFGGFNEPRITFKRLAIAILLDNRWLGPDVLGRETCRTQFVKLWLLHSHSISVDSRTFETGGQGEDHTRIHTTGKIGSHWNIRSQPFFDSVQKEPLEFIYQHIRIVSPFLFTLRREIHFPIGPFRYDRTLS